MALAISREHQFRHNEAVALDRLGRVCLGRGDLAAAEEYLEIRRSVPDSYEHAHLHRDLGELAARFGRTADASAHRAKAIELYRRENATAEADAVASRG